MKISDLNDSQLVQDESCINYFNQLFNKDYQYYFVDITKIDTHLLYGANSVSLSGDAYYVGQL